MSSTLEERVSATAHAKVVELGQHAMRMTTAAGSGHPSSSLAIAHLVVDLMYRTMRYDPTDPWNPNADRFVLSIGHAVPIVYAAYADLGGVVGKSKDTSRVLKIENLASLRELDSVLDGHPNPAEGFPFFDAATGSLGQGLSAAAGLALGARLDNIDKRIFVVAGDGESREGQFWEAADFIVDHKLTNVTLIVSCNGHGQAGSVSMQQSLEATRAKLSAFGWDVAEIDGHDPDEIHAALEPKRNPRKPMAVVARTVKGWGVDLMLTSNYHGKPVPQDELENACAQLAATGNQLGASSGECWQPNLPAGNTRGSSDRSIPQSSFENALERVGQGKALAKKELATRVAFGAALVALGDLDDRVVSLDADVSNSTFSNFFAQEHPRRFFECKIAEQNMVTAATGLAAAGKIPFVSSFGKFIARAFDQIDMAAITRANIKVVGSHTGVSLAADGPSQMAVTDVAFFRSMTHVDTGEGNPACRIFHPSDAVSAFRLTELAANTRGMCYLRTHRPTAGFLYPFEESFDLGGVKQLREGTDLTLVGSGYMLHNVLSAADQLASQKVTCNVFDAYTLPMDTSPILNRARSSGGSILVVEDNYVGGVYSELAEAAAAHADVRLFGLAPLRIPKSARSSEEVFEYTGVSLKQIVSRALELSRSR